MSDNKYSFIVVKYPERDTAQQALGAVKALEKEKVVKLRDAVAVTKTDDGKIKLRQTADDAAAKGLLKGSLIGLLLGIVFAPALIVAGAALGTAFAMFDRGIKNRLLKELGTGMSPQESALCVLVEQADWAVVKERMAAHNFQGTIVVQELTADHMKALETVSTSPEAPAEIPAEMEVPAVEAELLAETPVAEEKPAA